MEYNIWEKKHWKIWNDDLNSPMPSLYENYKYFFKQKYYFEENAKNKNKNEIK